MSEIRKDLQEFIDSLVAEAQFCQVEYGILASLTIAQAILESGWGSSQLAQKGNNLFGIKGDYCGLSVSIESPEWINGEKIMMVSSFRKYPSRRASIIDHAEFMQKPRYDAVRAAKTPKEACDAIQKSGYSTDPDYGPYLLRLIGQYDLARYDVLTECPYARYLAKYGLTVKDA